MKKGVIIQASSRSIGNTFKIVSFIQKETSFDIIDLNKKNIAHFDYEFNNKHDDFNELFKEIAQNYETLVFVTPIYWYTMSGLMKVFFDRISDFLFHEKDFGRLLRGKKMMVVSCGSSNEILEGFTSPFSQTAKYLGMDFIGHLHTWVEDDIISEKLKIKEFIAETIN